MTDDDLREKCQRELDAFLANFGGPMPLLPAQIADLKKLGVTGPFTVRGPLPKVAS